jgi:hypothetical protein
LPAATPARPPHTKVVTATSGDPALLDVLSAELGGYMILEPGGPVRTADPQLGTVVLYRPSGKEMAQQAAFDDKIDRLEPLTPELERQIHFDVSDAQVVVVYGAERTERMLHNEKICAPAGGAFKLCLSRSDEQRFWAFVVDNRPLPVTGFSTRGWFSWAAASPDEKTILAQWMRDCDPAVLIPAAGGDPQQLSIGSAQALGWTTDGRAIVFHGKDRCGGNAEPGVYLVAPDGEATLLARTDRPGIERSLEPRSVDDITPAIMAGHG